MKTNRRGDCCRVLLIVVILSTYVNAEKQKRQIFREQVLPALGGKIPEEAFKTDRLVLNRLNKEGITVPDGVVFDARHVHKHPHSDQRKPEIIKVYLTSDSRYVSPEGQFLSNQPKTVDSTYIIRKPFMYANDYKPSINFGNIKFQSHLKPQAYSNHKQFLPIALQLKPSIYKPIVTPLIFPTDDGDLFNWLSLNAEHDWNVIYEPLNDYFVDNTALFNSHEIIADYQGFINDPHDRLLRQQQHQDGKYQEIKRSLPYRMIKSNVLNFHSSGYISLTDMPTDSFS